MSALETTDSVDLLTDVSQVWDTDLIKQISQYIEIPAKSPAFDQHWQKNGFIKTVVQRAAQWVQDQKIEGLKLE
ncbi:MAG: peptidase M20, partial [Burkholderiaceae bacterium]|nr:peptidase M20 [Burkholderiaceae bacterium]